MPHAPYAPVRPRLHFTPLEGWLNDPNGLVLLDGEYHLFYQHHPHALVWGPMHWGHAVSRDLMRWEHLPIALAPDELGTIYSGSAVVDGANSAGFGAGALVAIFTHHRPGDEVQSLAFSTDKGRTWALDAANPVLAPPTPLADFRDPRVLWFEGPGGGHWVMALAAGQEIRFYTSPDLRRWSWASSFGAGHGSHAGTWECPELLFLPVDGGPEHRWVLAVSVTRGAPAGGSGLQYFVGDFDGERFSSSEPPATVRWADAGADFYAAQAWQHAPGGRKIWLAWMNNWAYARETPASTWRGMMSVPRELALTRDAAGLHLVQRLPAELTATWPAPRRLGGLIVAPGVRPLADPGGETLLIEATLGLDDSTARRLGLHVCAGPDGAVTVGYDQTAGTLFVECPQRWRPMAPEALAQQVPLRPEEGLLRLQVLVDTASVEVFAGDGRVVLTNQVFPHPGHGGLALFAEGGNAAFPDIAVWVPGA